MFYCSCEVCFELLDITLLALRKTLPKQFSLRCVRCMRSVRKHCVNPCVGCVAYVRLETVLYAQLAVNYEIVRPNSTTLKSVLYNHDGI